MRHPQDLQTMPNVGVKQIRAKWVKTCITASHILVFDWSLGVFARITLANSATQCDRALGLKDTPISWSTATQNAVVEICAKVKTTLLCFNLFIYTAIQIVLNTMSNIYYIMSDDITKWQMSQMLSGKLSDFTNIDQVFQCHDKTSL